MDIPARIKHLGLPPQSFMVVGSSVLSAYGIRESDDIDLIVTQAIFTRLIDEGWQQYTWQNQILVKKDEFDIGTTWAGETIEDIIERAVIINDIPYLSLEDLRSWKIAQDRDKDRQDIKLIDAYLNRL